MLSAPAKLADPETLSCEYCVPAVSPPIATSYAPAEVCANVCAELIVSVPAAGTSPASEMPAFATLDGIEPIPEMTPVAEVETPPETLRLPSTCASPPLTEKLEIESETADGICMKPAV